MKAGVRPRLLAIATLAVAAAAVGAHEWQAQPGVPAARGVRGGVEPSPLGFSFRNTAREAGLTAVTVFGGTETNKYLLETTGCGVAVLDFDADGWLDLFFVNGTVLQGFARGSAPTSHL